MYFWMHIFYPDKSPINGVGTTHCNWKHYHDQFTLMSKAYGNPDGYEFMRWKGIDPKRDIFFYDAELDKKAASGVFTKPYSHLYGRNGLGYVQMRSKGWESDSTIVDIKFSKYLWNHALQSNQGSFTIYHKGRLAMQTGTYDSFGGTDHWDYYYRRTIASCNMLIFVPGEFSGGGGPSAEKEHGFVKEPGGQCAGSMGRHNFTFKEWEWHVKHDPRYDWSQVTAYEHAPDFAWTYVSGDVTKAYSSPHRVSFREKRNLIVHNVPKIDLYTRSLVYIPGPNNVVIFDRVNTLDPSYRKAWLLHSIGKPDVNGKVIKSQAPGHHEDFDGDIAMNTWPGGISKPADVNDPGRLFVRTLLPKKHYIRRIGGKGYECWSMGANRTPYPEGHRNRKYLKGRDGQEIFADVYNEKQNRGYDLANWRIEVSPSEPKQFDNFLHLLHICDTKTKEMPASEMVESSDGNMAGVVSQGWLVMFGKKGEVAGEVSYKAPKNKTEHLVVDLKRGGKYQVSGIVGGKKLMTASKEGTLRFRSEAEGTIHISPRK
jgi:heparin/heparan-sulfate lyase